MPARVLENRVWTRQRWQTERDKLKVPKGAAKVSMGDAFDKYHKACAKGPKAVPAAAAELQKAIDAYKKSISTNKAYKPLADKLEKFVEGNITSYTANMVAIANGAGEYPKVHDAAIKQLQQTGAEFIAWEKNPTGKFSPSNKKAATAAMQALVTGYEKGLYYSDKFTDAQHKQLEQIGRAILGDVWNAPTVNALLKLIPKLPASP